MRPCVRECESSDDDVMRRLRQRLATVGIDQHPDDMHALERVQAQDRLARQYLRAHRDTEESWR
jgi:hypothetical protein